YPRSAEEGAGALDVEGDLREQVLDGLEPVVAAQPQGEVHGDRLPVEVEVVAVQDVGLHGALDVVEGGVGADRDRGREAAVGVAAGQGRAFQPAGIDAVGGHHPLAVGAQVGGRVAQVTAAVV